MYLLKVTRDTVFKKLPIQSKDIADNLKADVKSGTNFELLAFSREREHYKVTLKNKTLKGFNTFFVFREHIEIIEDSKVIVSDKIKNQILLKVPYFHQLENKNRPSATCNVTSAAMCLAYYGIKSQNPNTRLPDELYTQCVFNGWDIHSPLDMKRVIELYGLKDEFSYYSTISNLKVALTNGYPCIIHGYFTQSGHIIVLTGYNSQGFIVNDPYGEYYSNGYDTRKSGKNLVYSYGLIERTCNYDGQLWGHIVKRPNI